MSKRRGHQRLAHARAEARACRDLSDRRARGSESVRERRVLVAVGLQDVVAVSIAAIKAAIDTGFTRCASKPASRVRRRSLSEP